MLLAIPDPSQLYDGLIACRDYKDIPIHNLILTKDELASQMDSKIWPIFQDGFRFGCKLIYYHTCFRTIFLAYIEQAITDKVSILEFRHSFGKMFKDDMAPMTLDEEYHFLSRVVKEAKQIHLELEVKFIYQSMKLDASTVTKHFEKYKYLAEHYSDLVVAFDTVGEEDSSEPLKTLIPTLMNGTARFIFHAGESNLKHNQNMYDAILLNTTRIGHAIGLSNHPKLIPIIKEKDIAVEL